uniref:HDC07875 n=1 Tax=Drosophila melanogaster TaxID=7227 RepID=Q6IM01_DROME|nr:TPA_inf: HDC07875 [Drosophila melanogaster]
MSLAVSSSNSSSSSNSNSISCHIRLTGIYKLQPVCPSGHVDTDVDPRKAPDHSENPCPCRRRRHLATHSWHSRLISDVWSRTPEHSSAPNSRFAIVIYSAAAAVVFKAGLQLSFSGPREVSYFNSPIRQQVASKCLPSCEISDSEVQLQLPSCQETLLVRLLPRTTRRTKIPAPPPAPALRLSCRQAPVVRSCIIYVGKSLGRSVAQEFRQDTSARNVSVP